MALLHFAAGAAAAPADQSVDALTSANTELLASVERAEKAGSELPRITDPATRPIFEAAFDERVLIAVDKSDMNQLSDICSRSSKVLVAYSVHGIGKLADTAAGRQKLPAAALVQVDRNFVTNQNEVIPVLRFTLACQALQIPEIAKFWEGLPDAERTAIRRRGLAQVRHGITDIYLGVLHTQSQSTVSAANRAIALDVAVRHADVFASALTLGDRKAVIRVLDKALASTTAENRSKLLLIRAAMSTAACTGLCAVPVFMPGGSP
jgi:hypothetical protein